MKQKITQLVVIAIIKKDNKFLLTLRNQPDNKKYHGKWQLPGGVVEFGEHPQEALKREIKEELGLKIISVKLIPYVFHRVEKNWHGIFINYLCELEHGEITLNEEALEFQWFEKEQINKFDIIGPVYDLINRIELLRNKKNNRHSGSPCGVSSLSRISKLFKVDSGCVPR